MRTLRSECRIWVDLVSPSGKQIITASGDRAAKVWSAQNGTELFTLQAHKGAVHSVSYSPDGQRIMTTGSDGVAQIFTNNMEELLNIAENRITRQLTEEETQKYRFLDY